MYFMHSQGATWFHHSRGGGGTRKQIGSHCSRTQKLGAHFHFKTSLILQGGVSDQTMLTLERFTGYFSVTEQVTSQMSMIVENTLFT